MFPADVPHQVDESIARYTTYRIGGKAKWFALPRTKEHVWLLGQFLRSSKLPYFILGNGSNILASDQEFSGVIICTRELEARLEFLPGGQVSASASTLNSRLLRACADRGLCGIEALSGVPGNLGGAVFMNAGTASGWIDESLVSVTAVNLNGGERQIVKNDLKYSYRQQHFLGPAEIIFSATLQLRSEPVEQIQARLVEGLRKRKAAQPIELPSCGSVFRNPEGKNAWQLIDSVGLRGHQIGGARISQKHCNFIVNEGGATRSDVLALIELAKQLVKQKFDIDLHEEVVLMKEFYL